MTDLYFVITFIALILMLLFITTEKQTISEYTTDILNLSSQFINNFYYEHNKIIDLFLIYINFVFWIGCVNAFVSFIFNRHIIISFCGKKYQFGAIYNFILCPLITTYNMTIGLFIGVIKELFNITVVK